MTDDQEFYATIEEPGEPDTRVYANDQLRVRWDAGDHISIFNKTTYNREYAFQGETGDNSGSFKKVPNDDFFTGNDLDYIYAVYPYQESTKISDDGELTFILPAEQSYRENSFGLGANTMISVTEDNELHFKNLCGYFAIKLYGDNVSVKSISIKGNNNELLAGKATVVAQTDAAPTLQMDPAEATKELTLTCATPVTLGTSAETATTFWFVIPPTTFANGFTLTVTDRNNGSFVKTTSGSLEIKRNILKKSAALEVVPGGLPIGNIVFADDKVKAKLLSAFDIDGNGEISFFEAASVNDLGDLFYAKSSEDKITSFDELKYFTGLLEIGNAAFYNNDLLTSIIIPETVQHIGSNAFGKCSSLSSIVLPESVISIGDNAFYNCKALTSIVIPKNVISIGPRVLSRCTSLLSIVVDSKNQYYDSRNDCHALIETSTNALIAASQNTLIPDSVSSIAEFAFYGFDTYSRIDVPSGVTTIGRYAFSQNKLTSILLPDGITAIEEGTFSHCNNLSEITLPSHLQRIGDQAFAYCYSLSTISIPQSLSSVGSEAFYFCKSLKDISIPAGVSSIMDRTFDNCSSLSFVSLPNSIRTIGSCAFRDCRFESLSLPEQVSSIGEFAFAGCLNLQSINIPDSLSIIDNSTFESCAKLKSISIPESISSIRDYAFSGCYSLESVEIPNGVDSLGQYCFQGAPFTTITLPQSIKSIGYYVFNVCENLSSIVILSTTPPDGYSFGYLYNTDYKIFVPANSVALYKTSWPGVSSRIFPISPYPEAVDLGLSVKWASFNLGATKPEDFGDYYAWGETAPYYSSQDPLTWEAGKEFGYEWISYKWCNGDSSTMTKYCTNSSYGYNGFTDSKTVLDYEDDAASINWGGIWRMPTREEMQDLYDNCTSVWTTENGVYGLRLTSNKVGFTDKSIFLPAAGYRYQSSLYDVGSMGSYWSSSLHKSSPRHALCFEFITSDVSFVGHPRRRGLPIRPVCPKE